MSKTAYMRGLQNFIQEIRACQNKEQEDARIGMELMKIRAKFAESGLSKYDRRKYVWKLLYIHMLGHRIDFGFQHCCDLIPVPKYKDKQVGYMACSILLNENDESMRLLTNAVHQDLKSRNEAFECLALSFVGSVGGADLAEVVVPDMLRLLDASSASRPVIKKRAALALLRAVRKAPADREFVQPQAFAPVLNACLEEHDLGVLLASVTLLCGLLARSGPAGYESTQSRLIRILERMTMSKDRDIGPEYLYYGIPSPWLHSKCLRALQWFPPPEIDADRNTLSKMLQSIIDNNYQGDSSKPNKANAIYSIMFEAVSLALLLGNDRRLITSAFGALGRFLQSKDPNIKYLTLQALATLTAKPEIADAMRPHMHIVSAATRDADVVIRNQALDLMFNMADKDNVNDVVTTMLGDLSSADFSTKEDLVLKISLLIDTHAPDPDCPRKFRRAIKTCRAVGKGDVVAPRDSDSCSSYMNSTGASSSSAAHSQIDGAALAVGGRSGGLRPPRPPAADVSGCGGAGAVGGSSRSLRRRRSAQLLQQQGRPAAAVGASASASAIAAVAAAGRAAERTAAEIELAALQERLPPAWEAKLTLLERLQRRLPADWEDRFDRLDRLESRLPPSWDEKLRKLAWLEANLPAEWQLRWSKASSGAAAAAAAGGGGGGGGGGEADGEADGDWSGNGGAQPLQQSFRRGGLYPSQDPDPYACAAELPGLLTTEQLPPSNLPPRAQPQPQPSQVWSLEVDAAAEAAAAAQAGALNGSLRAREALRELGGPGDDNDDSCPDDGHRNSRGDAFNAAHRARGAAAAAVGAATGATEDEEDEEEHGSTADDPANDGIDGCGDELDAAAPPEAFPYRMGPILSTITEEDPDAVSVAGGTPHRGRSAGRHRLWSSGSSTVSCSVPATPTARMGGLPFSEDAQIGGSGCGGRGFLPPLPAARCPGSGMARGGSAGSGGGGAAATSACGNSSLPLISANHS